MAQLVVAGGEVSSVGRTVVVGVKLDSQSRELLTWALVKVAQAGDRLIALHVLNNNEIVNRDGKSSLLSLVKAFDSILEVYEGFCNLKQVDLKLKICRGSSVPKILVREAKDYNATELIVGTSQTHHIIRSPATVAKYCAKKLSNSCLILAVSNGKIVFRRESNSFSRFSVKETEHRRRNRLLNAIQKSFNKNTKVLDNVHSKKPRLTLDESTCGKSYLTLASTEFVPHTFQRNCSICLPNSVDPNNSYARLSDDEPSTEYNKDNSMAIIPIQNLEAASSSLSYASVRTSPESISGSLPEELEGLEEKYSATCRLFKFQELISATSSFMPGNMIGKGGSSRVYRGCLPDGKELAVKILKPSEYVIKEFVLEIEIITALHHKNIISLFGFCFEENNLLLVYDFLPRGSLEDNLHGNKKESLAFGWSERYRVAIGVAEALDYLHNRQDQSVIHRDVKSSNILLSDDFEPQLSDFGLAKWASTTSTHVTCTDVAGTFGYLAPEYFMHGKVNEKIDVYAYGVVLLELLSGRKPISSNCPKGQESLVMWAMPVLNSEKFALLLDPNVGGSYDREQVERMCLAASLCIRRAPRARPQMSLVVKLLQGDAEVLKWARLQTNASEGSRIKTDANYLEGTEIDDETFSQSNLQSHLNLALLDVEEDSSISSIDQSVSLEDYLRGRWSRSSSFD